MPLTPQQICANAKENPSENDPTGSIQELCNNNPTLVQTYIDRGRIDPNTGFEIRGGKKSKKSVKRHAKKSSKRRASKKARKTRRK